MTVAIQVNLWIKSSEFQTSTEMYCSLVMVVLLLLLPVFYSIFLTYNGEGLTSRSMKKKFEAMYAEIHNYRNKNSKYYIIVTMFRRMLFALIPAICYKYDYLKVQLLCLLSSAYIIWYAGTKPHIWNRRYRMEIFNECMIMLFNYHMILFTDFCWDNKLQWLVGGSF